MENQEVESALRILRLFIEVGGLSTFIFAATAQVRQFGLTGQKLTVAALVIGLVFGGCYRFFIYHPVSPEDWFWLVSYGLGSGFLATGAYKGAETVSGKKQLQQIIDAQAEDPEPEPPAEQERAG